MSTTQHTGHYNLPTFGDNPNDRPSWRGDFTDAMTKIDNQMYANATNITTATAAANNAKTAADAAKEAADNAATLAQTNKTNIGELDGYFSKLGVTSPQTAQNLMNTINGKAENTALTALQGTVSTLSSKVDGKADSSSVYTKGQADTTFTKQDGYSGTANDLNRRITALETSDTTSGRRLMVVGDSWGQHDSGAIAPAVASAIGATLVGNKCSSGAYIGSTTSGTQYKTVLQQLKESTRDESITDLLIIAGVNNMRFKTERPYNNSMAATVNAAHEKYPNAKVYLAPSYCIDFANSDVSLFSQIVNDAMNNGVAIANTMPYLISANWSHFATDMYHLKDNVGEYAKLGSVIGSLMNGNTICNSFTDSPMLFHGTNDTTTLNMRDPVNDGEPKNGASFAINKNFIRYTIDTQIHVNFAIDVSFTSNADTYINYEIKYANLEKSALFRACPQLSKYILASGFSLNNSPSKGDLPQIIMGADTEKVSIRLKPDTSVDKRYSISVTFPYM